MSMCFTFRIEGRDPGQPYLHGWDPRKVYFYNGDDNEIIYIENEEILARLREVYKESRGRDLVHYVWTTNAPVFIRIFGVLRPNDGTGVKREGLEALNRKIAEYEDAYWRPTHFMPKVALHIRKEPTRTSESLGVCDINRKYKVIETVTQCDWHWAKINHNGIVGWIAMGDITGEWYGEKFNEPEVL